MQRNFILCNSQPPIDNTGFKAAQKPIRFLHKYVKCQKSTYGILPGFCSAAPKATAAKAVLAENTVKQVKIKEFIMMQGGGLLK